MDNKPAQAESVPEKVLVSPAPVITTRKFEKPLSGLFAINKPSGVTSMKLLESLKDLFLTSKLFVENPITNHPPKKNNQSRKRSKNLFKLIKIGQGGTLDPLASGVLVVGLNSATKKLSQFLDCSKVYRTTGLLGCKTDSYDCDGKIVGLASWNHVKAEDIEKQCESMKGEHWQIPPIYSALKMDGKPLYEYARKNIPLPRPIESRKCEILDIKMTEWKEAGSHSYKRPTEKISEEDGKILKQIENLIHQTGVSKSSDPKKGEQEGQPKPDAAQPNESPRKRSASPGGQDPDSKKKKLNEDPTDTQIPKAEEPITEDKTNNQVEEVTSDDNGNSPAFTLEMTVSSGTYVRTIVHDIGQAVSSAATVVSLIRTRQGNFCLEGQHGSSKSDSEKLFGCIEWNVFEKAIQAQKDGIQEPCNEAGLREWEELLLKNIQT